MSGSNPPLIGVRVLDLSRLLPGPYCSQVLRDLGAEVIKIEDSLGDYCRYFPPLLEDSNGPAFHALNRGKKSIVLDFRKPSDVATFHSLCETAHVVLETFRPGVLNKFGLSPSQLRARHPHLVYCSVESWA